MRELLEKEERVFRSLPSESLKNSFVRVHSIAFGSARRGGTRVLFAQSKFAKEFSESNSPHSVKQFLWDNSMELFNRGNGCRHNTKDE